jgi:hypothetical protein
VKLLITAIEIKINDSIKIGVAKMFSFLFSLNISIKKLDEKEPTRNENIYKT